jgi:hypothetical protein
MAANVPAFGRLEQSFLNQVEAGLSNAGYKLSNDARTALMSQLLIPGVQLMQEHGEPTSTELERARNSLSSLTEEIVSQAKLVQEKRRREMEAQGVVAYSSVLVTEIESSMITFARMHLCPPGIWPFC